MERFLYRLSKSPHARKFILKGALLFTAWKPGSYRPTMDIDLLGKTPNQEVRCEVDFPRTVDRLTQISALSSDRGRADVVYSVARF